MPPVNGQRIGSFAAGVLTSLAVVAGLWLAQRLNQGIETPSNGAAPSPTPSAKAAATPSATVAAAPPGFRLAGVAVNDSQLYAVIEAPNGSHSLYRQGEEVPGLGRLLRVAGENVLVATTTGNVTLWVAPAATATPTITRRPATATPKRSPRPTPAAGGSAPGSSP